MDLLWNGERVMPHHIGRGFAQPMPLDANAANQFASTVQCHEIFSSYD